jgi:hypothetical protein
VNDSRDRDAAVDRALRRARRTPSAPIEPIGCLDAETVAAWLDGGLRGPALDVAQAHVARCPRCQALVGAAVRSEPAERPARGRQTTRQWWGWLVPVAAAAAVAIWIAVPHRPAVAPAPTARSATGQAANGPAEAKGGAPAEIASAAPPPRAAGGMQLREAAKKGPVGAGPRAVTDALAAAQAPKAAPLPSPPPPKPAAPAPRPAAAPAAETAARLMPQAAPAGRPSPVVQVRSPDSAVRWRLSAGSVERSTDAGSSWEAVAGAAGADLLAGAAPSATVCWLVGRGGVVLRSTDGRTLQRVSFPEATDLSAVTATDQQHATVTAANGRQFRTSDGGRTWVAGSLQDF